MRWLELSEIPDWFILSKIAGLRHEKSLCLIFLSQACIKIIAFVCFYRLLIFSSLVSPLPVASEIILFLRLHFRWIKFIFGVAVAEINIGIYGLLYISHWSAVRFYGYPLSWRLSLLSLPPQKWTFYTQCSLFQHVVCGRCNYWVYLLELLGLLSMSRGYILFRSWVNSISRVWQSLKIAFFFC